MRDCTARAPEETAPTHESPPTSFHHYESPPPRVVTATSLYPHKSSRVSTPTSLHPHKSPPPRVSTPTSLYPHKSSRVSTPTTERDKLFSSRRQPAACCKRSSTARNVGLVSR
ncbi:hypothetical protein EYF80_044731 [Liparis tanakae]|uniref:Uncharacterized protein n=1 Tax=Liparis tanakae TaxID=230148 RepID=A0A4Z2FVX6_9TELE|nr:hypothetical protein EYF80_044731 [Liparis tanakae]